MTEADDIIKLNLEIDVTVKEIKNSLIKDAFQYSPALAAHGKLLALTSEKITLSVNKLHESSKRLECLNKVLILYTIILTLLTVGLIFTDSRIDLFNFKIVALLN